MSETAVQAPATTADPGIEVPGARLPRVNLLPAVVHEELKERRARLVMLGAVRCRGGRGGTCSPEHAGRRRGQDDYDAAVATGDMQRQQEAQYAEVPKVTKQYEQAQAQMAAAMGPEILWSGVLGSVARLMPDGMSVTGLSGTLTPAAGATATTGAGAPSGAAAAPSGAGTLTVTGGTASVPLVARWLDNLVGDPDFANGTTNSVQRDPAAGGGFTYDSSATLTDKALSHRYDQKASGS
jgi:Tfp pilus assembly protein PilN